MIEYYNNISSFPQIPSAPGTPEVVSTSRETITIKWQAPTTDGGSVILGYHVEKKDRNSILWMRASKTLLPNTEYKVCKTLFIIFSYSLCLSIVSGS